MKEYQSYKPEEKIKIDYGAIDDVYDENHNLLYSTVTGKTSGSGGEAGFDITIKGSRSGLVRFMQDAHFLKLEFIRISPEDPAALRQYQDEMEAQRRAAPPTVAELDFAKDRLIQIDPALEVKEGEVYRLSFSVDPLLAQFESDRWAPGASLSGNQAAVPTFTVYYGNPVMTRSSRGPGSITVTVTGYDYAVSKYSISGNWYQFG